jgi:hypothetical protein
VSRAWRRVSRVLWERIAFAMAGLSLLIMRAQVVFWEFVHLRWDGDVGGGLLVSLRRWVRLRILRFLRISLFHFGQSLLVFRVVVVDVVVVGLGMEMGWDILEGILEPWNLKKALIVSLQWVR